MSLGHRDAWPGRRGVQCLSCGELCRGAGHGELYAVQARSREILGQIVGICWFMLVYDGICWFIIRYISSVITNT